MAKVNINGNNNISNSGVIEGSFIVGDVYVELPEVEFLNILRIFAMNNEEKEQTLLNMTETQKKLADAIEKFAQAELIRAEADRNNSEANLNYSKIMLEDRAIIKQLMEKLK